MTNPPSVPSLDVGEPKPLHAEFVAHCRTCGGEVMVAGDLVHLYDRSPSGKITRHKHLDAAVSVPLDGERVRAALEDSIVVWFHTGAHDKVATLRALASALAGMEQDSEHLREMEAERDRVRAVHVRRHERLSAAVGLPVGYSADATIDAAIKIIDAARAARPEETKP